MKWSDTAWHEALPIYNSITTMPFIKDLANGTLAKSQFKYYLQQDAHYLEYFARSLAIIAAKVQDVSTMLDFVRFAEGAIIVERALHDSYFKEYNITQREPISPACNHYVHYLQSTAYATDVAVAMAAVLPCFWIYKKVGDHILEHRVQGHNPYQNWMDTYAGEEFGLLVQKAIALCDAVAANCTPAQQQKMTDAFITASRLEYTFWDSAYRLEKW